MKYEDIAPPKLELLDWATRMCGELRSAPMTKENFLRGSRHAITSIVRFHKSNPLIKGAVMRLRDGDLNHRAFLILSILYGSHPSEPDRLSFLKDFIGLLENDLEEEEVRTCKYAEGKRNSFYPELYVLWKNIQEVWQDVDLNHSVLPPTPYIAYGLMVLNRSKEVHEMISGRRLFVEIADLNSYLRRILELANRRLE